MPHIHGVLWLEKDSIRTYLLDRNGYQFDPEEVTKLIDAIISCSTNSGDADLDQIVREVQVHHHTKTCKKGARNYCRFGYPRLPSNETIIALPLEIEDVDERKEKMKLYKN